MGDPRERPGLDEDQHRHHGVAADTVAEEVWDEHFRSTTRLARAVPVHHIRSAAEVLGPRGSHAWVRENFQADVGFKDPRTTSAALVLVACCGRRGDSCVNFELSVRPSAPQDISTRLDRAVFVQEAKSQVVSV